MEWLVAVGEERVGEERVGEGAGGRAEVVGEVGEGVGAVEGDVGLILRGMEVLGVG